MKIVLTILIVCVSGFGEYQKAKIDMHGGKNYSQFGSKSGSFGTSSMGFPALLDVNSSKKSKEKKDKK